MKLQAPIAARQVADLTLVRGRASEADATAFDHWLRLRLQNAFGGAPENEPLSVELDAVLKAFEGELA